MTFSWPKLLNPIGSENPQSIKIFYTILKSAKNWLNHTNVIIKTLIIVKNYTNITIPINQINLIYILALKK